MPKKIGLLGGSFNPAHEGHLHISREAISLMGLNEVWWLVSPQNPNKPKDETADYEERLKISAEVAKSEPKIKISDFEREHELHYTYETLVMIKKLYPDEHFVWLMGADNLATFDKWYNWEEIFKLVPIAVFDRNDHKDDAILGTAAQKFLKYKTSHFHAMLLPSNEAPSWCYFDIEKHPASSTQIRDKKA